MPDPFDLERFVQAQDPLIARVRLELRDGRKRTHWMWFVFPQLRALGHSPMAQRFGIASLAEAQAYLAHPVLARRLIECTRLVLATKARSIHDILGSPDDLKFRSSITLFSVAHPGAGVFDAALRQFFGGEPDARTIELLSKAGDGGGANRG